VKRQSQKGDKSMEMRTRILPHLLNSEVEDYLQQNDIIFVPVGTVEMHGGYPLDSEAVIGEAFALEMAEACDGLMLPGLQYFYAGATASGRGTVQVGVRAGIDYLSAVAHSLLRQGFKRQVYLSFHGPAMMTCSPMVRDFFDETGVPILYIDLSTQMNRAMAGMLPKNLTSGMTPEVMQKFMRMFHSVTVGAYDKMGRLADVPLVTGYQHSKPQSCAAFNSLFGLASQSGSIGYCFAEQTDHMATIDLPDEATRAELAAEGRKVITATVESLDPAKIVQQMRELEAYNQQVEATHPWMPSAYNKTNA
jgi:creatinine amidohydrolase